MVKKTISRLLISFLLLTVFFLVNVSAAGCWIETSKSTCESTGGNYAIMRLSASTNAHGELISGTNYVNVLCCDFGDGTTTCSGGNKIIGLSSSTNAHAEEPILDNYGSDVCYEDLICKSGASDCGEIGGDSENYPIGLLSLSSTTNAHIGVYEGNGSYNVKICCESDIERLGGCEKIDCLGAVLCGDYATEFECGCDSCSVAEESELCGEGDSCQCEWDGEECRLNIEDIGNPICGDDKIDSGEQCDGDEWGDITGCIDFDDFTGGTLTCDSSCEFNTSLCEDSYVSKVGKCTYNENTEDDCEDKFLTYSWTAIWTWSEENVGHSAPCGEGEVLDDGLCYYDPRGAKAKCVDGSSTVPCPAQIQLPFFGKYSVLIIITLITLIYVFSKFKKKKNSKKK